jgi:MOSC domain-containing protein YiiM
MTEPSNGIDSATVGQTDRHLSIDVLEAGWAGIEPRPTDVGRVRLLVRRGEGGLRDTPRRGRLTAEHGLFGDAWGRSQGGSAAGQLTVMEFAIATLIANGQSLCLFGDQLFIDLDLSRANLPTGSRLEVGTALLEVTEKPHNGCLKFRSRFGADALRFVSRPDLRDRNFRGIYMQVLRDGEVEVGDAVRVIERPA